MLLCLRYVSTGKFAVSLQLNACMHAFTPIARHTGWHIASCSLEYQCSLRGLTHQCTADASDALVRQARDTALAAALKADGLGVFVESWYRQPMWASLVSHPRSVFMCCDHNDSPNRLSHCLMFGKDVQRMLEAQAPRALGSYLVSATLNSVDLQV